MESWDEALLEEHQCPGVVRAPSCGLSEVLELRDVIIKCVTLHLDVHQFVMCVLDFGSVGEGAFEVADESGP